MYKAAIRALMRHSIQQLSSGDYSMATDGGQDAYNNRAALFLEKRWGRLMGWEDYEDTERIKAWDARHTAQQSNA